MDLEKFSDGIEEIYAIFNKKMPEDRAKEVVYRRIKDLPPQFMDFAIRHFEDQETLPRNMGYYLKRVLWPEFLDKNPDMKSKTDYSCCPQCLPELPGWRRVWGAEMTGWGELVYLPLEVRCACGNARNPRNEPIMTDDELIAKGFFLENPYGHKKQDAPESWKKGAWDKNIGLEPDTSREHREYTERHVELEEEF